MRTNKLIVLDFSTGITYIFYIPSYLDGEESESIIEYVELKYDLNFKFENTHYMITREDIIIR